MSSGNADLLGTFRIEDGVPHIGDRAFPWALNVYVDDYEGHNYVHHLRGFHLPFETGAILSVQWGTGYYCANRESWSEACRDAEISVWPAPDGAMIDWAWSHDIVVGWVTTTEVLHIIDLLAEGGIARLRDEYPGSQTSPGPSPQSGRSRAEGES